MSVKRDVKRDGVTNLRLCKNSRYFSHTFSTVTRSVENGKLLATKQAIKLTQ